ncbi:zinc knuckle (CCHC-type) family protein [Raphanus sativus]|nr:zinc knuckle (CCHC-type) family protein [Raphanus sativus]
MTRTCDLVLAPWRFSDPFYVFYYNVERKTLVARSEIQGLQELKYHGRPPSSNLAREVMADLFWSQQKISPESHHFYCKNCGQEGHIRHYCPELDERMQTEDLDAGLVGEKGNNQRVFKSKPMVTKDISTRYHRCGICGESGHNSRTCWKLKKGRHNVTTRPSKRASDSG